MTHEELSEMHWATLKKMVEHQRRWHQVMALTTIYKQCDPMQKSPRVRVVDTSIFRPHLTWGAEVVAIKILSQGICPIKSIPNAILQRLQCVCKEPI